MVSIIFQQLAITGKKFHSSIRSNIKDGKFAELKKFKKDKYFRNNSLYNQQE